MQYIFTFALLTNKNISLNRGRSVFFLYIESYELNNTFAVCVDRLVQNLLPNCVTKSSRVLTKMIINVKYFVN